MIKRLFIFLTTLPLLAISCSSDNEEPQEYISYIAVGDQTPQFQVTHVDGTLLRSSELSGKRVMIVFFIVSCPHCRSLMPVIEEVWLTVKESGNVAIIPVGRGERAASVVTYWESEGFTMPAYADTDRLMYDKFAEAGVPRIYMMDENGTVIWSALGEEGITADLLMSKLSSFSVTDTKKY